MSDANQTGRRSPMWLKTALVLSLVANMAVVGLYLGQMSKAETRKRGADRQIAWIIRFAPENRRTEVEKAFEAKQDQIRELYRDRNKYFDEILQAIRAEPFAPETMIAAMRARRENSAARRIIVEEATVELLSRFTPEERAHFAREMEEGLKRWRERRASR